MGDDVPNIQVPEEYQEMVLKALAALRSGAVAGGHLLLALLTWLGVLLIGALLGFGLYGGMVFGMHRAVKQHLPAQLRRAGLGR